MKKVKLLTPIFGLVMASSICMPLSSCSNNETKVLETLFVSTTTKEKEVGSTFEETDIEVKAQYKDGTLEIIKYDGTGTTGYDITGTKFGCEFTTVGTYKFNVIFKGVVQSDSIKVVETKPEVTYHTVSFDTGVEGLTVDSQTVENNTCAIEPAVRREGYQIDCWTYNDLPFSFKTPVTADMTLKAVWSEITVGGGNLDSIQYPSITPAEYKEYTSTDEIVEAYLAAIKENTEIFKQDILYSWSCSHIVQKIEYCRIIQFDKNSSNVSISNITVNADKKQIEFDAEVKTELKIKDTIEKSWIEWIGWNFRSNTSTSILHFKLDLNDKIRQLESEMCEVEHTNTAIDSGHVRYIGGICGIRYNVDSTVKVISESGTMVDLDGQTKEYTQTETSDLEIVNPDEIETIKTNYPISYSLINSFINFDQEKTDGAIATDQYVRTEKTIINGENIGYKFASSYMAASNLNKDHLFEYVSVNSSTYVADTFLVRINRAFDDLHFQWIMENEGNTITLPDGYVNAKGNPTYTIAENAFNSSINKAIPNNCTVKLSENTKTIREKSFYCNKIAQINIPQNVTEIGTDAFYYAISGSYSGVVSDVVLIDSATIAAGLEYISDVGHLIYTVKTIKLRNDLTTPGAVTDYFTQGEDETIGSVTYHVWNRNS